MWGFVAANQCIECAVDEIGLGKAVLYEYAARCFYNASQCVRAIYFSLATHHII